MRSSGRSGARRRKSIRTRARVLAIGCRAKAQRVSGARPRKHHRKHSEAVGSGSSENDRIVTCMRGNIYPLDRPSIARIVPELPK
jgi:hypothetical protein